MAWMWITQRAKRRYIQRIRPGADEREAYTVLRDATTRCSRAGRSESGEVLWVVDRPDMVLVSKHDARYGAILVTVLHPDEVMV